MRRSTLVLPFTLTILASTVAQAQERRFGIQLSLNQPQGDLAKEEILGNELGFGFGIHGIFDLGRGHALRPRADYLLYGTNTQREALAPGYIVRVETKLKTFSFGLDYLYHVNGRFTGFYLVAGLNHNAQKFEESWAEAYPGFRGSFTKTWNKVGFAAGVGYQFHRRLGGELRYTATKFGDDLELSNNNLQFAATWRF